MLTVSADASPQARLTGSEEGPGRGDATKMQSDVMRPSGSELPMALSYLPIPDLATAPIPTADGSRPKAR